MVEYRKQWKVQGSAKDPYTVSVTVDCVWSCSCIGWTRHMPRSDCKHIKKIKAKEGLGAPLVRADIGKAAPTAKSLVKAGATKDEAADAARVKREQVQGKKDAKLGKLRYGFQLAEKYDPAEMRTRWNTNWVAEVKYDGILAMWIDGRFINRSGNDVTKRFPEIRPNTSAVLVGEIVVLDANGMSNFQRTQERSTDNDDKIAIGVRTNPATFAAFDVLEIEGRDVTDRPCKVRRAILESLESLRSFLESHSTGLGPNVTIVEQIPVSSDADVQVLVNKCRELETEGVMIKDLSAPYVARRGRNWVKAKTWQEDEFPVVRYEDTGVGDGFVIYVRLPTGREQRVVVNGFKDRAALKAGFASGLPLIAEIKFLSASKEDGALRFPSFRRLAQQGNKRLIP